MQEKSLDHENLQDNEDPETTQVCLTVAKGQIVEASQLNDYAFRGPELEEMNFVDFCVFTNHKKIGRGFGTEHDPNNHGPNPKTRSRYHPEHPQSSTHFRQVCTNDTKVLPCYIGARFATPDNPSERLLYVASMQVLYRPWKTWDDVMTWAADWEAAYASFYEDCSPFTRSCMHNTQLCRQAQEAVDAEHTVDEEHDSFQEDAQANTGMERVETITSDEEEDINDFEVTQLPAPYTENPTVMLWAEDGVRLGAKAGLLPPLNPAERSTSEQDLNEGAHADASNIADWLTKMDEHAEKTVRAGTEAQTGSESYVIPGYRPLQQATGSATDEAPGMEDIRGPLNPEQRLAFDIIEAHLSKTMEQAGNPPAQLLMKVLGPPGTGKSSVIEALTKLFELRNARHILQKSAHQGSAASIIGGSTLYSLLYIRVNNNTSQSRTAGGGEEDALSARVINALKDRTRNIKYLIIDETSQVRWINQN
jgi:hypothetical protein